MGKREKGDCPLFFRSIRRGEAFTVENLTTKRPGAGISPMRWDDILKMKASRDFYEDEIICL